MAVYSNKQITAGLKSAAGWKKHGDEICKTFVHHDFVHAMGFVQSLALLAEKMNHHPNIDIRWNKVTLTLSTHSEGGLTEKDFTLAQKINTLV